MVRASLGPNYSLYRFSSIKDLCSLAFCLFMALYSCQSWFRGSEPECSYFQIFPPGRKTILLTDHAILEGEEGVSPDPTGQISQINLVIVAEYYVSTSTSAQRLFYPLGDQPLVLWSSVPFS